MAMYKQHSLFNIFCALPIFLAAGHFLLKADLHLLATFGIVFTYSTLFMSPDMDLANKIRLFSIRGLLTLPFRSYAKFFSHRGISHSILFGSLTRILWLACWFGLIMLLINQSLPNSSTLLKLYSKHRIWILYGAAGICLADWCHLLLDRKELKKS